MMNLSLDHTQAKALDCSTCDPGKMRLRNCNGSYGEKSQSPMLVNGDVYRSCPRAIVAQDWQVGYLVTLYFECRENKISPFGGTLMNTTAFCKEAFDLMDERVSDFRQREHVKQEAKAKKEAAAAKAKSKGKR